jgi:hypothetical protein
MTRDPNDPTWIVDWWKLGVILTVIVAGVYLDSFFRPLVREAMGGQPPHSTYSPAR